MRQLLDNLTEDPIELLDLSTMKGRPPLIEAICSRLAASDRLVTLRPSPIV